jgi:hypothetical protein
VRRAFPVQLIDMTRITPPISFFLIFLFTLMALFSPCHADGRNNGQKILGALSIGLVDSAFIYLGDAVKKGLPDDSLYYLWAEIYIARGNLDTALALSIAGQRSGHGSLTKMFLTQRYNIYLALGLKRDADELLDTILRSTSPVRRSVPRFTLNSWIGGNWRNSLERQSYPFITETPHVESLLNPGWDFSPSLSWFLPLPNDMILVPGVSYSFTNGIEHTEFTLDSLNHALGLSLDLKNILRRFSLGYALQGRIGMFGNYSMVNTAALSRSTISESAISYSSLMYSIEIDENKAVSYQAFWLMHYLTRKLTSTIDLNVLPMLTCFLTDDLNSSYTSSVLYIEDPHADTVMHYTDASCTQLIPIPDPLTMISQMLLLREYRAASDIQTFSMNAPESYCGITPAIGLDFALPHGFSIEGMLKGMVNYYIKEHEWTSLSIPFSPFAYDSSSWLAYSRSDGNYYLVDELGNIINAERYSGPLDIRHYLKRRIDYMIGGELTLERKLWNIGTLGLNAYVKKYRSTLQDDLPVKMKNLFYGGGISFRINFGAAQPAAAL